MNHRKLGRTGLKVSPLCLGTMNFGPLTKRSDAFVIMDRALELGINFFDTANVYGQHKGAGATETIVGNWFAKGASSSARLFGMTGSSTMRTPGRAARAPAMKRRTLTAVCSASV